jgi:transcription-repair coupling factor (superfamily II helicase)
VGFSLYSDMLNRAVAALRNGEEPDLDKPLRHGVEVELHVPALIPESYLADVQARLTLYKRIASARDDAALRELQVEMIDRFGLLPEPVKNLFAVAALRLDAERIGIEKLDLGPNGGRLQFSEDTKADPAAVIRLIQQSGGKFVMNGPHKMRILLQESDEQARFRACRRLLDDLQA